MCLHSQMGYQTESNKRIDQTNQQKLTGTANSYQRERGWGAERVNGDKYMVMEDLLSRKHSWQRAMTYFLIWWITTPFPYFEVSSFLFRC